MAKQNKTIKGLMAISIVILLIGNVVFIGLLIDSRENKENNIETKPPVNVHFDSWAENYYDDDEMIFSYWVLNYGDREVKNVNVKCNIYDEDDNVIKTKIENFGNIASNSVEYEEMILDKPRPNKNNTEFIIPINEYGDEDSITGTCFVDSCDDCDILYKRIPELVRNYEK